MDWGWIVYGSSESNTHINSSTHLYVAVHTTGWFWIETSRIELTGTNRTECGASGLLDVDSKEWNLPIREIYVFFNHFLHFKIPSMKFRIFARQQMAGGSLLLPSHHFALLHSNLICWTILYFKLCNMHEVDAFDALLAFKWEFYCAIFCLPFLKKIIMMKKAPIIFHSDC